MSYSLNEKIKDLKPYDPIQGEYQIRLDANESFLSVPNEILEQFHTSVNQIAFNRYPDPYANATITAFGRHYGVKSNLVTAGNGSDELIQVIMSAFLMKGDRVLTLSHDFSMYRFYTSIVEAECIEVPKNEDLTINVDNVIETANEKQVRMIIFSNPCNPSSLVESKEDVLQIVRELEDVFVIGNFAVDMSGNISREKEILHTGDWSMQGYVNYPGGMIYQYKVPQLISDKQVLLHLGEWRGTLLKVRVNGKEAGFHFEKKNCVTDVTGLFEKEENTLEIEVSGSPRNMFGPFHQSYTGCSRISWADFRTEGMFHTDGKVLKPYGMMGQSYICEYEEQ